MGGDKLMEQIFNLKFMAKQLSRAAVKSEKVRRQEQPYDRDALKLVLAWLRGLVDPTPMGMPHCSLQHCMACRLGSRRPPPHPPATFLLLPPPRLRRRSRRS